MRWLMELHCAIADGAVTCDAEMVMMVMVMVVMTITTTTTMTMVMMMAKLQCAMMR